jgi:hypothetical protein
MSLYCFDMLSTDGLAPDEEGLELSTMDDVQNEAAYALADMLRDDVRATMGNPTARELMIVVAMVAAPCCKRGILLRLCDYSKAAPGGGLLRGLPISATAPIADYCAAARGRSL